MERAWYVLAPTRLSVYTARDEKDKKFELAIAKACQVVVGIDDFSRKFADNFSSCILEDPRSTCLT